MNNFTTYQHALIHNWIKKLFALGAFLIPLFGILDYYTVPDNLFITFLVSRFVGSALLAVVTLLVHFSKPSRWSHAFGYMFSIIVGGVITWMTVQLGGFDNGYYAGLSLVIIAVNLIMPWSALHTVMNSMLVLFLYVFMNTVTPHPFQFKNLINNLYFLSSTAFIASLISWIRYDLLRKEYDSRLKADESQMEEIKELASAAEQLSNGNFTVDLDLKFNSTAATLLQAFQKMRKDLKGTLQEIALTSNEVEGFARQIMDHTQNMATRTERQSEQAGQSIETIKSLANDIRENAEEASQLFHTAEVGEQRAKIGQSGVIEAIRGMKNVEQIVTDLSEKVRNLGMSSRRIGDIIKVIIEIADQTNMLALNASIEAARAGELGRGFAVVAEEVGKLADRTTNATRETNSIIQTIQNEIQSAIEAMDAGSNEIERTILSVEKLSVMAQDISDITSLLIGAVRDIAETGHHQAKSSEGINDNIAEIHTLTTTTSHSIKEVAVVAEQLHKITEKLQRLAGGFQIGDIA